MFSSLLLCESCLSVCKIFVIGLEIFCWRSGGEVDFCKIKQLLSAELLWIRQAGGSARQKEGSSVKQGFQKIIVECYFPNLMLKNTDKIDLFVTFS